MHSFVHISDWVTNPFLMIVIRSLAVYLFMILAIRIFGKKELAQLSVIDLVFILLISNSVQNAMVGPDTSLEGGLIAALSLFAANFTLKKVLYRNTHISNLIQGVAIMLIYQGKVNTANCIKAEITLDELAAAVREHGAENFEAVNLAMLEVDGNISIISKDFTKRTRVDHPRKHKLKGRLIQN